MTGCSISAAPVTGSLFFVPSATFLDNVTDEESPAATVPG